MMAVAPRGRLNSEQSLPPLLTRVDCDDGIALPTSPSCGLLPNPRGFNSCSSTSCLNIPNFDGNDLGPSALRSLSVGAIDQNLLPKHTYKKRHSSMNHCRLVHVPRATICSANKTLAFEQGQVHKFFDRSGSGMKNQNQKLSCINRWKNNGESVISGDVVDDLKQRSRVDFKPLDIGNVTKILQNPNVKDIVGSHPFEKIHPINETLDKNPFNEPSCNVLSTKEASSPPNDTVIGASTTKGILDHNTTLLAPVILESKWDEAGFFNSPHPSLLPLPKFCTKQRNILSSSIRGST